MQACSGAGKNEEAVQGMEQLCGVKADAGGANALQAVQAAGTSLEARLQASQSPVSAPLTAVLLHEAPCSSVTAWHNLCTYVRHSMAHPLYLCEA